MVASPSAPPQRLPRRVPGCPSVLEEREAVHDDPVAQRTDDLALLPPGRSSREVPGAGPSVAGPKTVAEAVASVGLLLTDKGGDPMKHSIRRRGLTAALRDRLLFARDQKSLSLDGSKALEHRRRCALVRRETRPLELVQAASSADWAWLSVRVHALRRIAKEILQGGPLVRRRRAAPRGRPRPVHARPDGSEEMAGT